MAIQLYCPKCEKQTLHGPGNVCSECKRRETDQRFEEFKKLSVEERTEALWWKLENLTPSNPILG